MDAPTIAEKMQQAALEMRNLGLAEDVQQDFLEKNIIQVSDRFAFRTLNNIEREVLWGIQGRLPDCLPYHVVQDGQYMMILAVAARQGSWKAEAEDILRYNAVPAYIVDMKRHHMFGFFPITVEAMEGVLTHVHNGLEIDFDEIYDAILKEGAINVGTEE